MNDFIVGLLFIGFPFLAICQNPGGVQFDHSLSWSQVKAKAKLEGKYIFLDLFATWCAPCKMMDAYIYPIENVGEQINKKFIAVKVQMDSTQSDDYYVKSWYNDSRFLEREFKPSGFPTFLFFTSSGELIYKDQGFKTVESFLRMDSLVLEPKRVRLYSALEDYKSGKKDYSSMLNLALFTHSVIGDNYLATQIAKDYKYNILDTISKSNICRREYLQFFGKFNTIIDSGDNIFRLCYENPERVDSIMGQNWAERLVKIIIMREEVSDKVKEQKNANMQDSDWDACYKAIRKKFSKVDARWIVLTFEANYYRNTALNWGKYINVRNDLIAVDSSVFSTSWAIYVNLNVLGAWDVFLHCNERSALKQGIVWINMAIERDTSEESRVAYLDTKANLIYKLGKIHEAISLEKMALKCSHEIAQKKGEEHGPYFDEFTKALKLMKLRKPTYVDSGAIWNKNTLPD